MNQTHARDALMTPIRAQNIVSPHGPLRFPIRRHSLASIKAAILLGRPISLVRARLENRLRFGLIETLATLLEFGARLVEGLRGAVGAFSRVATRIEPAIPAPGSSPGGMPVRIAIVPTRTSP